MNTNEALPKSLAGEYACLSIHNEEYGVRTSEIRMVMDIPAIRKVPKAPDFIEGVANIGGRIVPLLNPITRFGLSKPKTGDEEQSSIGGRLVLIQLDNSLYGVMVDGISSINYITEAMIEPLNPLMIQSEASLMGGMAKFGEKLIYLIETEAFVSAGLREDSQKKDAYDQFSAQLSQTLARKEEKKSKRFLGLAIGNEAYGIDSAVLKELVPAASMEQSPGGPHYLAGIIKNADGALPVIDLQKKFNLDRIPYSDNSRVVIIDTGTFTYGIIANSITEFLNISDEEIKKTPTVISGGDASHIKGVGILEGGERLVILLNEVGLLSNQELKTLGEKDDVEMYQKETQMKTGKGKDDLTFVIFSVQDMEFAFNLDSLSEIIQYKTPTPVPKAAPFIRGIVPVTGELVPVIDLKIRFDLRGDGRQEETRIIIIRSGKTLSGVIADSVFELLSVAKTDIAPAPKIVQGVDSQYIEGMIRIKESDRTPIVLNIDKLLTETDKDQK